MTLGFRKAISTHYANDNFCRYVNVEGTTQEPAAKELIEMARKRFKKYGIDNAEIDFAVSAQVLAMTLAVAFCAFKSDDIASAHLCRTSGASADAK